MSDEKTSPAARALAEQAIDAVYCVNLQRRDDRRRFMSYKLERVGLQSVVFWPAVDGRAEEYRLDFEDFQAHCAGDFEDYPRGITPGACGLILTWRALIDDFLRSGSQRVLILEDDVYFHTRFVERLAREVQHETSVVYLGGNQVRLCEAQQAALDAGSPTYPVHRDQPTWGTFALVIRRAFAEHLMGAVLSRPHRWNAPLDWLLWRTLVAHPQLQGVVVRPSLIIPEVRDSENMGPRDIVAFAESRGLSLGDYQDLELYPLGPTQEKTSADDSDGRR